MDLKIILSTLSSACPNPIFSFKKLEVFQPSGVHVAMEAALLGWLVPAPLSYHPSQ